MGENAEEWDIDTPSLIVYKLNDSMKIGLAYLYDQKESRTVSSATTGISGKFEDASAHLVTASFKYKF